LSGCSASAASTVPSIPKSLRMTLIGEVWLERGLRKQLFTYWKKQP
jgi:hypothetical protein